MTSILTNTDHSSNMRWLNSVSERASYLISYSFLPSLHAALNASAH